mgnify:CR=1 FL=1
MDIEKMIYQKMEKFLKRNRGLRKKKFNDIFKRSMYISPSTLEVLYTPPGSDVAGKFPEPPVAAFNPGAVLEDRTLYIFPRVHFDYFYYPAAVGVGKMDAEEAIEPSEHTVDRKTRMLKRRFPVKLIFWPECNYDFEGTEDPRVQRIGDRKLMLYTGKGRYYEGNSLRKRVVLSLAEFNRSWETPERRGYFVVELDGERYVPPSNKDSAFLWVRGEEAMMLTRPEVRGRRLCWKARANLKERTIYGEELEPVLGTEKGEDKVGWSTNPVKVSEGYLVGWHAVLQRDSSYNNGLALIDRDGELLAVSEYLLFPDKRNPIEAMGDRPLTLFGCGLVRYRDYLIWIGGLGDKRIGIFVTELERALSELRYL